LAFTISIGSQLGFKNAQADHCSAGPPGRKHRVPNKETPMGEQLLPIRRFLEILKIVLKIILISIEIVKRLLTMI
jgi:hypothetical protein